ncbi:hypothetical protein [Derxia lacustris]|uniref:hypothetical protein n=1 Tax=Derxia lacustris TaxID=764842 RepID=UPI00159342D2|nr:hypothetical protein [Derxia lacustris]
MERQWKKRHRRPRIGWLTALALALGGCGGGSGNAPEPHVAPANIHVDPASNDVPEGGATAVAEPAASTASTARAGIAAASGATQPDYLAAASLWRPLVDVELAVQPGSALDLSDVLAPYARRDRALCANWTMTTLILPDTDAGMTALVAEVRRRGYNLVRLHYLDQALLNKPRAVDRDFDPVKLDRFYRLTAALAAAGIGYALDVYSGDASFMSTATLNAIGWDRGKLRLHYDSRYIADWKAAVDRMLASVNPYTGRTLLRDPALKLVIGVNEGGIVFKAGFKQAFEPELAAPWNRWLLDRYGSTAAWRAAWAASPPASTEDPAAGSVALPAYAARSDARSQDFARFMIATESALATWMRDYLAERGYTGVFSNMNVRNSWEEDFAREPATAMTYNVYHDHPNSYGLGGSIRDDSALDNALSYLRIAAQHRYLDRPFYLTEASQVFWNRYRREFALAGAFASHQGWQGLCSFGAQHDALRYDPATPYASRQRIETFQIWGDPILTAVDRINAFLYRRGDVAEGKSALGYVMRQPEALAITTASPWTMNLAPFASKRSLLYKIGIVPGSKVDDAGNWIGPGSKPAYAYFREPFRVKEEYAPTVRPGYSSVETSIGQWYEVAARAREYGGLPAGNITDATADILQNDSNQITYDLRKRTARIITPKSELVTYGELPTGGRTFWMVSPSTPNATASAHSLDDLPLTISNHVLLVHLTDARNTGMKFSDTAEKTIADWGKLPVTIRGSIITARFIRTGNWKLYALDLQGNRIEERPLVMTGTRLEFKLDNTVGDRPVLYYELVKQ